MALMEISYRSWEVKPNFIKLDIKTIRSQRARCCPLRYVEWHLTCSYSKIAVFINSLLHLLQIRTLATPPPTPPFKIVTTIEESPWKSVCKGRMANWLKPQTKLSLRCGTQVGVNISLQFKIKWYHGKISEA